MSKWIIENYMVMHFEFKNVGNRNEKVSNATIVERKVILQETAIQSLKDTIEDVMRDDILMIV